jgi:hypothetical protein
MEFHARALLAVLESIRPDQTSLDLLPLARLVMQLLAAAVRYAISLDEAEGETALALYKKMLPVDLGRLV